MGFGNCRKGLSAALVLTVFLLGVIGSGWAQDAADVVPTLVNFSGTLSDLNGNPLHGIVGVTFLLYKEQTSVAPLWLEMQNVQADEQGHYSVMLGLTKRHGLPTDLFASGEARWLGVQAQGQAEQPRVLLLSVPYALKAGDAQTLGGLPASAFMQANPGSSQGAVAKAGTSATTNASSKNPPPANPAVTGTGLVNFIPMWDSTSDIVDSVLFQRTSQIGVNTTTPAATLDVNGKTDVRDTLTLFPKLTDNTLSISGTNFKIDSTGKVTFIAGQIFPGTGTITGITTAAGSGLSGGGTTGTLSLKIPAAGVTNAMLASSKITLNANAAGGLTTPGAMTLGGTSTIGLKPCSANQVLQFSGTAWNCSSAGTGTITGVTTASGSGLTGGGTSGTLNLSVPSAGITNAMLQHPSLTVTAGNGLTGGGAVTLGGTTTLSVNTSVVPQLNTSNAFTQPLSINVSGSNPALSASASGLTILANMSGTTSGSAAVVGNSSSTGNATTYGVLGSSGTSTGAGVFGSASGASGTGVYGNASATGGNGVRGQASTLSQFQGVSAVGVWGDSSSGSGVYGTSDSSFGVLGASSSGIGLYGEASTQPAVYGYSLSGQGVYGFTANYVGTYGQFEAASETGNGWSSVGVWGDSGWPGTFGVLGTTDDGNSLFGKNNTVNHETLYVENDSSPANGNYPLAARFAGPFSATWCEIYMDHVNNGVGDLLCTGTKSAAVPVDGNRMVRLYAMEAADNWFEDAGAAELVDGRAMVNLDRVFAQTVNGEVDYHVFLTPNGECEGLYVASKGPSGFEVRELHRGHSNISFDYRIMARRKGYETVRMEDVTAHFELARRNAQELGQRIAAAKAARKDPRQGPARPVLKRSESQTETSMRPLSNEAAATGSH